MNIYFISGLGADERVFQNLVLPSDWHIHHLKWILPFSKEHIRDYCFRFAKNIDTTEDFIIVGLSFGGIIAVELSKILQPKLVIVLSSISTKNELPIAFKAMGKLKLNRIVPAYFLNKIYPFTYWYFGVKTREEKKLLKQIIKDTSRHFLKWAIGEILTWKNDQKPKGLFHIHGTKDRIFPINRIEADVQVESGGHLMVYTEADVISKILKEKIGLFIKG